MNKDDAGGVKPCPYCGSEVVLSHIGNDLTPKRKSVITCPTTGCGGKKIVGAVRNTLEWCDEHVKRKWNSRPIEDALTTELSAAQGEIERLRNDRDKQIQVIKVSGGEKAGMVEALEGIQEVILTVENRCMTHVTVTPTLQEMTEEEMRRIWLWTQQALGKD